MLLAADEPAHKPTASVWPLSTAAVVAEPTELDSQASRPITWFERFDSVPRVAPESLGKVDPDPSDGFIGPRMALGEWVVQLTDIAEEKVQVGSLVEAFNTIGEAKGMIIASTLE